MRIRVPTIIIRWRWWFDAIDWTNVVNKRQNVNIKPKKAGSSLPFFVNFISSSSNKGDANVTKSDISLQKAPFIDRFQKYTKETSFKNKIKKYQLDIFHKTFWLNILKEKVL